MVVKHKVVAPVDNFISKEDKEDTDLEVTLIISTCNQRMKFSEISLEAKIHLLTSLTTIMTIFSIMDSEQVDLQIWVDLDKWEDFMKELEEDRDCNMREHRIHSR